MVAYMITGEGNITVVLNAQQFNVPKGDSKYEAVLTAIKEGKTEDELLDIVDTAKKVKDFFFDDDVKVQDGEVLYKGEAVHNTLTERIVTFMKEGLPCLPLVNFLKKLMENPSFRAQNELFDFLNHKSLPITEDGDFLAYKAVKNDFYDKYSGKVLNTVGEFVEVPRSKVDDNREVGCSQGLHAGTLEYVNGYGKFTEDKETTDRCLIVKIHPADVVSVPTDCNYQKLRTCKYLVVKEFEGELTRSLYTNEANDYEVACTDEEDEYCDNCGELVEDCTCEDEPQEKFCTYCGKLLNDCIC